MFDTPYALVFRFKKNSKGIKPLKSKSTYFFNTDKETYILECEEYSHDIHIIKFFPKRLKDNSRRFNVLTGENKLGRIVATCIELTIQILKKNPLANFGFIGSHTFDPKRNYLESKIKTKRFVIYRYAVFCLIGEETFTHYMEEKNSTYLLINNKNSGVDVIKKLADEMFNEIYPSLNEL